MSNNKTFIALPGGKECKPVNPYPKWLNDQYDNGRAIGNIKNHAWLHFEANNLIFPITEVMPEGETFEGSLEPYHQTLDEPKEWKHFDSNHLMETDIENGFINCAGMMHPVKYFVKPLKAIEPVNEVQIYTYEDVKSRYADWPTAPLLDVVENKETVEQGFEKWQANIKTGYGRQEIFEAGADWQQSQSIEGIVGFVLEWVSNRGYIMVNGERLAISPRDNNIKDLEQDIIKELKK